MVKKYIKLFIIVLMFVTVLALPIAAFASDVLITTDKADIVVGDSVTVTIAVGGENMAVVQGTYNYDYNLLMYQSSTGGAADGKLNMISLEKKGASTLTAVIEFKAIGSGALDIDVSVDDILDASGANLESLSASLTINIQEAPQPPPDPEATTAIVTPFELDGVPAVNVFGTDEDRYVWRSVQNLTLPSGFVDAEIIYGAETVGGATNGADEPTLLLYLSDINGENAGYYIFNAQYNTLQPYIVARSVAQWFTLLWPDNSVVPPDGYIETTVVYDEKVVPAWMLEGTEDSAYLVFAQNKLGEKTFFQYIPEDQSFQRFVQQTTISTNQTGGSNIDELQNKNIWIIRLCIAGGLLLITVVILLILYMSKRKDLEQLIVISNQRIEKIKHKKE